MKNRFLVFIFVVFAGAGTVYFASLPDRELNVESTAGTTPLDADYDYYIEDMLATRFSSEGQPVSQLKAQRVTHYPDGERAELLAPEFRTFGGASDPWQVKADTGTLAPDTAQAEDRLDLAGNVELHKALAAGNFVDIRTQELTVFVDSEEVRSAAAVTVRTRDMRQEAVGMRALLAHYIQLNDGKGTYDPAPNP